MFHKKINTKKAQPQGASSNSLVAIFFQISQNNKKKLQTTNKKQPHPQRHSACGPQNMRKCVREDGGGRIPKHFRARASKSREAGAMRPATDAACRIRAAPFPSMPVAGEPSALPRFCGKCMERHHMLMLASSAASFCGVSCVYASKMTRPLAATSAAIVGSSHKAPSASKRS